MRKTYNSFGLQGCISLQMQRDPKVLRATYHSEQAGLDREVGVYITVCEDHGAIVASNNFESAVGTNTTNFCDDCREGKPATNQSTARLAYEARKEKRKALRSQE